jgi:acetolactate synthase-1/2/3 large subunit
MSKMNGAEYMAKVIASYGTTHIFFVEAILRMMTKEAEKLGLKGIMTHSENAAGYMADGYARASGRPGICMAQSIGSANLAAGIGDAWLAGSPVIAFTGKKPPMWQYKNAYQEADHWKLFEGLTKFNAEISDINQLPFLLRQCYKEVVSGKPRPAHLDVPGLTGRDLESATIDTEMEVEKTFSKYPPFRTPAEARLIDEAANEIDQAFKPVIVIGRGAAISGAGKSIYELAVKADIPVVSTPDGKALIDEYDDIWAGIVGFYGMSCANYTVSNADLIIFIGTQTADQTTNDWTTPLPGKRVIQIDVDPTELGKNYPNSIGLLGDADTIVSQLNDKVKETKRDEWRSSVRQWVGETLSQYEDLKNVSNTPMMPERLCQELEKSLPEDAVLVSDTGYSAIWTSIMMRMKPSQRYFRAAGSLGWAYPGSLGVKCALPDKPVFCFIGDAGFYYHSNEMETAAKYGINVICILNNNRVMAQGLPNLTKCYPEDRNIALSRISYPDISFSSIAEKMGLFSITVHDPKDIDAAVNEALKAKKPALIEVITFGDHAVPSPTDYSRFK